jgi:hypothetical protein
MAGRTKRVRMCVTVSVPVWLSAADARREVRALINDQAFYGTRKAGTFDEIDASNLRAVSITAVKGGA